MWRSRHSLGCAFVFTSCLPQATSHIHSELIVSSESSMDLSPGTNLHPSRTACVTSFPATPWVLGLTPLSSSRPRPEARRSSNAAPTKSILLKQRVWVTSASRQGSGNGGLFSIANLVPWKGLIVYRQGGGWCFSHRQGRPNLAAFMPTLLAGICFLIRKK